MDETILARLTAALEGRYTVEREIGEGGMATVYLATDLKHNRRVALKVLKPELAAVVGAERFLSEIQTTANLNHPHILPLHDSGEADGFLFYVMPYLEGESLRDRLDRERQLPVGEAVRITTALANALDHAHRHGVIHRDIKPANILLQDGEPVVADFGIALAVGAAGGSRLTETGLSLGTPYYMSPEQATGDQMVGPASDTYALACVLYEMLVGEPPYPGSTAQAVLGKIIAGKPVSATEQRPSIPLHVDAAIRCALEKLPADRFTSAQDFVRALGDESFRYGETATGVGRAGSGPWNRLATTSTALAAAFALACGWLLLRAGEPELVERFSLSVPDVWFSNPDMSVSPDGSTVVFGGLLEGSLLLFYRRLGDLSVTAIPGTEGGALPAVSPDGREVAFWADNQLRVTRLEGGVVRTVADSVYCCITWNVDDFLYFSRAPDNTIARVPADGGAVEALTERGADGGNQGFFHLLPDGDVGVFTVWGQPRRIEAVRLSTGERKVVTPGVQGVPLPKGHLMFVTDEGQVMVAPFDARRLELTGAAVPVIDEVQVQGNGVARFAVSGSGTVVYWRGAPASSELELVWVTRAGDASPVDPGWTFDPSPTNGSRGWALSPGGDRIAVKILTDLGADIWLKELPDGPLSRLTFAEGEDRFPRWVPEGGRVSFLSAREGNLDVWTRRADGVGDAELLYDHEMTLAEADWSPDGEWLILRTGGTSGVLGGRDILALRPGVDSVASPLVVSEFDESASSVSPDGRWLAYQSNETGRREIFIRPFPDAEGRKIQVSDGGGRSPVWSHGGEELYYVTDDNSQTAARDLMVATIRSGPPLAVAGRRVLFSLPAGFYFAANTTSYAVTADDQRFLMARDPGQSDGGNRSELILIQNFFQEVKERVRN